MYCKPIGPTLLSLVRYDPYGAGLLGGLANAPTPGWVLGS